MVHRGPPAPIPRLHVPGGEGSAAGKQPSYAVIQPYLGEDTPVTITQLSVCHASQQTREHYTRKGTVK